MRPLRASYKFLFFDLDHTLWDYAANSRATLLEIYHKHKLQQLGGFCADSFCTAFASINRQLWGEHEAGKIGKEALRSQRFVRVLESLGQQQADAALTARLDQDFLALCPLKPGLLPFARDVLQHFHARMPLYVLTNGFADVQEIKLRSAGIARYFKGTITADEAGAAKPDLAFFQYALKSVGARPEECLMIGDNLKADIIGAASAGIDSIYYNPARRRYHVPVQHDIQCLSELLKLF